MTTEQGTLPINFLSGSQVYVRFAIHDAISFNYLNKAIFKGDIMEKTTVKSSEAEALFLPLANRDIQSLPASLGLSKYPDGSSTHTDITGCLQLIRYANDDGIPHIDNLVTLQKSQQNSSMMKHAGTVHYQNCLTL